ncbi:MFS transporter [Streptacidiphilus jiangxiensis]|uniref:Na+/melibiose symporter n=1 Tax=Streptacidiphilus jiangxiensis TaxID=235985 RepID=A0A1H7ZQS2_STRJI|nr:MFS transporter [Streptacidiphilus jiangxiensis]SEM59727.1 Na+/melibiose symporter [Streptacidiphilus jiangxiensis]
MTAPPTVTRPPAPSGGPRFASRFGLPDLRGNGRFVAANAIDSLGNGLMMSFPVVFFARTTSLSLVQIGTALTLGQLLAIPAPAVVGALVDRLGARRVVVAGNLVSAAGFALYLGAHATWAIIAAVLVVQCGGSAYWTSSRSLVVLAAREGDRAAWFAFTRALRNIGAGAGAAGGALALGIGSTAGLRGVVVADAASFVLAAWLLATWCPRSAHPDVPRTTTHSDPHSAPHPAPHPASAERRAPGSGYLTVLRDRTYLRLVAANVSFVFAALMPSLLLAVYVTRTLRTGAWLVGVLIVVNTALVATVQTPAGRLTARRSRTRTVRLAAMLNAVAFAAFATLQWAPAWLLPLGAVGAMLLFTAAEVIGSTPMSELSVDLSRVDLQGRYQAAFQLSWTLGGAVAPLVFTILLSAGPTWPWVFLALTSLLTLPALVGLRDRTARAE